MAECIFCQIAEHKTHANIVLEDDEFMAFFDINPVTRGHTLVIPKKHVKDFADLTTQDAEFIKRYLVFIEKVRQELLKRFKPDRGIRVSFNTEKLILVQHLHAHLIPVY